MNFVTLPILAAFLAPGFALAGLVLAGVPILIHLLNRRRHRTVEWAAMAFLLRAMKRNRRRLRFESWLLLATRCTVLALLGLALARPLGCSGTAFARLGQHGGLHVLVIDTSYSMAYQSTDGKTHFDRAKQLAEALLDRLTPGDDSVALITAGAPAAAVLAKPTYDLQQARSAIDRLTQQFGATDLPQAARLALAIARENGSAGNRSLYLFTDATRSAWLSPADAELKTEGPALAAAYHVTLLAPSDPSQSNAAVVDVSPVSNLLTVSGSFGNDFSAVVRGYGGDLKSQLQWRLDGAVLPGTTGLVLTPDLPAQLRPGVVFRSAGAHVLAASLTGGDRLPVDDDRLAVVNVLPQAKVLIVKGQRGAGALGGSGAFLQLALSPPPQPGATTATTPPLSAETISDLELGDRPLTDLQAVILCGVGQIRPSAADQLQQFVQGGGTLMLFMGEPVTSQNYNDVLLPRHLLPGPLTRRVSAPADQSFTFAFDPNGSLHPLLAAFAHQQNTGLGTAQIFTYWQVDVPADPQLRVLNYRPTGTTSAADPAITVDPLGQGRVIFVSTTANADWTTLPAKPAYVALVNELLANSINRGDGWMNLTVGHPLEVPPSVRLAAAPALTDPHAAPVTLQTEGDGDLLTYRSGPLLLPGQYILHTGGADLPIAVNPPAADEADVRSVDPASIRAALGGIELNLAGNELPPAVAATAGGSELGWDVMLTVGSLVALECFLAMFFGHSRRGA